MNRRAFMITAMSGAAGVVGLTRLSAQAGAVTPDLGTLADTKRLTLVNREAARLVDGQRIGVRLSEMAGEGVALLPDIDFANGTIELDIRGRNVPQRSFVGVAFHAVDGRAYDAIYFRPFNFRAVDPVSRDHAVQYHSLPGYGWQALRTDQPGKYEQAVNPVPDPDAWFRARVVVANPVVSVFVGDATTPCLVVNALNGRTRGLVGLWVGNNSGGDFANLTITHAG